MFTYKELSEKFKRCRDKHSGYRLPGRNGATRIVACDHDGSLGIRLYNTTVVRVSPDNIYTITPNGWHSKTTNDRLKYYSPISIFRYADTYFASHSYHSRIYEFVEGMRFDAKGRLVPTKGIKVKSWTRLEFYGKYKPIPNLPKYGDPNWKSGMRRHKLVKRGALHEFNRLYAAKRRQEKKDREVKDTYQAVKRETILETTPAPIVQSQYHPYSWPTLIRGEK